MVRKFPETVARQDLAAVLDLSPRHVSRLAAEHILVRDAAGNYPLAANIARFVAYGIETERRRHQETAADRLKETRRLEIERSMEREDRKIIALDESIGILDAVVGMFVEALDGIPGQMAQDQDERARLRDICDEIRTRLSQALDRGVHTLKTGREI